MGRRQLMRATDLARYLAAFVVLAAALLPRIVAAAACTPLTTQYGVYGGAGTSLSSMKINGSSLSASGCTAGSPGTCNSVATNGAYTQTTQTLPAVDTFQTSSVSTTSTLSSVPPGDYGTLNASNATFSGGTYRITTLNASGTFTMNAGTYYINRFDWGAGKINININSGPVVLIIGSYMGSTGATHKINDKGNPGDLQILLEPSATFSITNNTISMAALLYSSYASSSFTFGTSLTMEGAIITAGTVTTGNTFALTYGATAQAALANLQGCNTIPNNFLVEAAGGGAISTQVAGQSFNIRVTARDASNATLTSFTGTVVITSTGTLSQGSGTTASFVNGVLSSWPVTISNTGTFTITATLSGGSANGTSNAFDVVYAAGRFNAFEQSTPANALTGVIKTKISGQSFTLDIIALNAAGNAYAKQAISPITVELLDASDNSGALNTTTNCRSSWTLLSTITTSFSLANSDNGRKALTMSLARAAPEVRVRISTSANGGVSGCSNDNFAVRPLSFISVQAADTNDTTVGTARVLNNSNASSGVVHRAGRAFSVLASAVNADGSTVTTGYNGTPTLTVSSCAQPTGCSAGTLSSSLTATNGVVAGTATYAEAGVIGVTMNDSTFAAVDAGDSTLAERTISSAAATFGRFVPDSYRLTVSTAPQFTTPTCGAGPGTQQFTYVGQTFTFGTVPVVLSTPLNASGVALANARPRFDTSHVTASVSASGTPVAFNQSVAAASVAQSATSLITFNAGTFSFTRGTTPVASFTPTFTMTVNLADTTENGTSGNTTINAQAPLAITPIAFAGGYGDFHYARLQMRSAYGDVRSPLYVPLEIQRYNGSGWVRLTQAGSCFSAPAATFAYSSATGLLTSGGGTPNCATRVASTVTTTSGQGLALLAKPGNVTTTQPSAMTMTLNLQAAASGSTCNAVPALVAASTNAMPWLTQPDGSNPSARLTWGRMQGAVLLHERFD